MCFEIWLVGLDRVRCQGKEDSKDDFYNLGRVGEQHKSHLDTITLTLPPPGKAVLSTR